MFKNSNILIPTDFSPYSNHAMTYGVSIARQYGGVIHFLHVIDDSVLTGMRGHAMWLTRPEADTLLESMREHAASRLTSLVQAAADLGVNAEQNTVVGAPATEILRVALEKRCTLVVLATHGRSGFDHIVFGSVAEKVVRQCPVPVLSIKHPERDFVKEYDHSLEIKRVLFPTDFSSFADKALPFAVSLCRQFSASLTLLHATEIPVMLPEFMPDSVVAVGPEMEIAARQALDRMVKEIEGVSVEAVSRTGIPHREICHYADEHHVDLVIIPTHGRSGLGHVLFGSVAEKVVRLAKCPVMTIRPEWNGPEPLP